MAILSLKKDKDLSESLINSCEIKKGAIVVGIHQSSLQEDLYKVQSDLEELIGLLKTLGVAVSHKFIQKRIRLNASHLLGKGKLEEISQEAKNLGIKLIVIDHPLSSPQVRNIEKITDCLVLDRSAVIIDIFAKHAQTKSAKIQVEIARLEYLLPRLTGAWTHFQRQAGGGVRARGMGETQIEVDRRRARQRLARLQKQLNQIAIDRVIQKKSRENEIKVAIVGYTNSGKTTLMSLLTKTDTTGQDELFATLDARVRTLDPASKPKILLSDTVGFIRNLPHSLIASFKSTLEEVVDADLLLHVVDLSHENYSSQMITTEEVLKEIGAGDIPQLFIFNKMDKIEEKFLTKIIKKKYPLSICVSAFNNEDIINLRKLIIKYFEDKFQKISIEIDSNNQTILSLIYRQCLILSIEYNDSGSVYLDLRAPLTIFDSLLKFKCKEKMYDN